MVKLAKKKIIRQINKNQIVTLVLIIVVLVVVWFIFQGWQGHEQITQPANIDIIQINTNQAPEIVRRPTLETAEADHLWIPDRGIEAPVIYITQEQNNNDGHQEALAKGVVHYPGTALPGEKGNPYIFGHSSDYFWKPGDYKEVFKPLVDIPIDTDVRITNPDGELFIYKVIETKIVGPDDTSVLDQLDYARKLLSLQASWPIGTALKRYIAICELDEEATYGPSTGTNTNNTNK